MIDVKSFVALRRFSPDKLQKLNLFETERFFCDVYCLEPGQEQKAHAHAGSDKLYAVLEGAVEVRVGAETREQLLARRAERQRELDRGQEFRFLPETQKVRDGDWKVAYIPEDLAMRFVEITGPVERKMMIK